MTVRQPFQESSSVGQMKLPAALPDQYIQPAIFIGQFIDCFLDAIRIPHVTGTPGDINSIFCFDLFDSYEFFLAAGDADIGAHRPSIRTMYRPIPVAPPVTTALLLPRYPGQNSYFSFLVI